VLLDRFDFEANGFLLERDCDRDQSSDSKGSLSNQPDIFLTRRTVLGMVRATSWCIIEHQQQQFEILHDSRDNGAAEEELRDQHQS
jgi:hypothetical protein